LFPTFAKALQSDANVGNGTLANDNNLNGLDGERTTAMGDFGGRP
jgi:hypothetical protein